MEHIMSITAIGTLAGVVGTALGGVIAVLFSKTGNKVVSFILEYSAGLMVAVVCFDLLPTAFEFSDLITILLGVVSGILFAMFLQDKVKYSDNKKTNKKGLLGTGIMMFISIAAHNFPEGLAIGSGYGASIALGISLTIVIIFHDVPEGLALALPLKKGGYSAFKTIGAAAISGVPTGIGAFIGASVGYVSKDVIALCLALAAGAMLYVSVGDLIPESKKIYNGRWSAVGNVLGLISGIIISLTIE